MSARVPIGVRGIHHVELWAGNAKQAAHYYRKMFGFSQRAYAGLETGSRDKASYVLAQGNIRFVLSSPLGPDGPMVDHLGRHGDGVQDIAFEVENVDRAFELAIERGAVPAQQPRQLNDEHGTVRHAAIKTYGDTIHSLIERGNYRGPFLPSYCEQRIEEPGAGLVTIDHVVGNVELGAMDQWAEWYAQVFGFSRYMSFDDKDISTEYTALRSVVMSDERQFVKMPINEPAQGKRRSQIQEYLDFYHGPGVQHVALLTDDIIGTIGNLVARGGEFLEVPKAYYDVLSDRVGNIDEPLAEVSKLGILVDRDENGYLLQLFTKPVQDRPTLFFEVIQRKGARGFGKGNFKALFESIEREQQRRGTL